MGQSIWKPLLTMLALVVMFNLLYNLVMRPTSGQTADVSYSRFRQEVAADNVSNVVIKGTSLKGEFRKKITISQTLQGKQLAREVAGFTTVLPAIGDATLMPDLIAHKVDITAVSTETSPFSSMLIYILPWLFIIGIWWFAMRGMKGQNSRFHAGWLCQIRSTDVFSGRKNQCHVRGRGGDGRFETGA